MLFGVWSNFGKKKDPKMVVCFDFEENKMSTGLMTFGLFDKNWTVHQGTFSKSVSLTQGTWTLVKLCRRNFCNAIKSEYSPNNFTNPKLKNVHFWKDFFYNISPIIGSSNHKGIVFLFFVSLDENQSSQYSLDTIQDFFIA